MRLTTRLAVAISALFAAILLAGSLFIVAAETRFVEEQIDIHGQLLGRVVASMAEETWRERGSGATRELLREIDHHESRIAIRWVDLGDSVGAADSAPALDEELLRQLARGEVVGRVSPTDSDVLNTYVPLGAGGSNRVIEIAESLERRNEHLRDLILQMAAVAGLGFVLSAGGALLVGRRLVGGPVGRLIDQARRVGEGDLSASAPEMMSHELGELGREMNQMTRRLAAARERTAAEQAARLEMEERLRHADKLATVGRLAAGIAHEVGTPLQAITMRAELIRAKAGDPEAIGALAEGVQEQAARIGEISRGLLRFARKEAAQREPRDLREILRGVHELVRMLLPQEVEVIERIPRERAIAEVDDRQITQVVTNLVMNSIQAMPGGGRVILGLERTRATPPIAGGQGGAGDYFCLYVEDEGSGIPEDVLPHIFEPFYTTKESGEGTGLGLSISYGIVQQHGGWMDLETESGRGTRVRVYLPPSERGLEES